MLELFDGHRNLPTYRTIFQLNVLLFVYISHFGISLHQLRHPIRT